ncbi:IucA/IucC family protein [Staphylococcus caeli]|uniref:IucA/IucC family protein n=1 Tax=Staphylococcus caeli TaxID=2201815 RepID=UPI003F571CDF
MNSIKKDKDLIYNLTDDEAQALSYLNTLNPEWANHFKSILLLSRDKITQRLVSSLHRENLVNSREYSAVINAQTLKFTIETDHTEILKITFPHSQKILYAPISGHHAFDRIDVEGPFYFENHSKIQRVLHPNEVLDCILTEAPHLDNAASYQFKEDINNSSANMAIALSYQSLTLDGYNNPIFDLIANASDSYLASEQSVIEGHPLHPGAKLRKGMTPETAIAYSSEFANTIKMQFILIHQSIAKVESLDKNYNALVYDQFEGLYDIAQQTVGHEQIENYYVMAVHPWQYQAVLYQDYATELEINQIVPLNYEIDYFAGLSFRTLMPKYPKCLPHIKLSTNVHITGEIRTLSEQTTINGPQVTQILNDIQANDALFKNINAATIDEMAGIHFYNPKDDETLQPKKSAQLGTLFRENIYNLIAPHTVPMIPSSLVSQYANNLEAPIVTLIKNYTASQQIDCYETAALTWIKTYSQALIDLALPLYVKYGIALEAHLQNSIATFSSNGLIHTLYIRDFEGLRIDEAYLNTMGYQTTTFHEKSLILTDSAQTVFNKVFYSSIQNHLGELIATIAQSSEDISLETQIWTIVRAKLVEKLDDIAATMDDNDRIQQIAATLFAPKIDYKCVTTMRLEDEADYYTYIQVDNPLYLETHH